MLSSGREIASGGGGGAAAVDCHTNFVRGFPMRAMPTAMRKTALCVSNVALHSLMHGLVSPGCPFAHTIRPHKLPSSHTLLWKSYAAVECGLQGPIALRLNLFLPQRCLTHMRLKTYILTRRPKPRMNAERRKMQPKMNPIF